MSNITNVHVNNVTVECNSRWLHECQVWRGNILVTDIRKKRTKKEVLQEEHCEETTWKHRLV